MLKKQEPFTLVRHNIRKYLGISAEAYFVLDAIYFLSRNQICFANTQYFTERFDISLKTLQRIKKILLKKGLIQRESNGYITTHITDCAIAGSYQNDQDDGQNDPNMCQNDSVCTGQIVPNKGQNDQCKGQSDLNKGQNDQHIINNTINNNNIITETPQKNKPLKKEFIPPTPAEVKDYIKQKNLSVDAEFFFTYFTDGSWKDSNGKQVHNWKQKILTWDKAEKEKKANRPAPPAKSQQDEINERYNKWQPTE